MNTSARNPRLDGRRVGLIVPSVNATIEPEFAWMAPAGLSFHAARVMLRETTEEGLRAMNAEVGAAAALIASVSPDVVAYACTSGSFLEGSAGLRRQVDAIAGIVCCPVVATSAALIEALRALRSEDTPAGLLRGLADVRVSAAIRLMHADPARSWTVAELAEEAALSRSSFFDRFTRVVGMRPMEYLLAWRMAVAKDLLRCRDVPLSQIAERVGYSSASTFSTAFSRSVGRAPGRYARALAN